MMAAVSDAVAAGDAARLRRAAHTLKGASSTFGARAAWEAAHSLEKIGASGDLAEAAAAWDELRQALEALLRVLAGFAAGQGDGAAPIG